MSDLSVFGVQKAIENICGSDVKNTTVLKDGSLLIQTKNRKQADKLLKNKTFAGITKVEVTEHESLTQLLTPVKDFSSVRPSKISQLMKLSKD